MNDWAFVAPGAPYFVTESGAPWVPVGHNSAIAWPDLAPGFGRKDLGALRRHLEMLAGHGVNCLRLMLEYCHREHRYFEQPVGTFKPRMVQFWDDLFALCEQTGIRILLTPFDTFWMWIRWKHHPYNAKNGGPCRQRSKFLLCGRTRQAIKNRLDFVTRRWGGSSALFAWDLMNEIHPAYAGDSAECFSDFIDDVGGALREREIELHGRAHPQTVSVFSPHMVLDSKIPETIFRHPELDFATTHVYQEGTIDHPRNTVDAAISMGELVQAAIAEIPAGRPFFDSEHGPIHTFKDRHKSLPEPFDDEYFRHIQWAHLAAGGAGGGMRWPNRNPHTLTMGMHREQRSLAAFLPLIDWANFRRRTIECGCDEEAQGRVRVFACADGTQAVLWMVRRDCLRKDGMLDREKLPLPVTVRVPGLCPGRYQITLWDTAAGQPYGSEQQLVEHRRDLGIEIALKGDMSIAIRRVEPRA